MERAQWEIGTRREPGAGRGRKPPVHGHRNSLGSDWTTGAERCDEVQPGSDRPNVPPLVPSWPTARTPSGLFPGRARCSDVPTETLLERIITPLFILAGVSSAFLRRLQHGLMHVYMMYIFATLLILMLWAH